MLIIFLIYNITSILGYLIPFLLSFVDTNNDKNVIGAILPTYIINIDITLPKIDICDTSIVDNPVVEKDETI